MTRNYLDTDEFFKKMIALSLAFHAGVILIFTVRAAFFPSEQINFQAAIRVDIIGLPEKLQPEIVEPPKPEPVAVTKEEKKVSEKKTDITKNKTEALRKLKNMSAFEKLKNLENSKKEMAKVEATQIKGNIISPGSALRGLDKIEYNDYLSNLQSHVHRNWALPEWMARMNYKAIVIVKIDKTGMVIEKFFKQVSGNADFDQRVIETIESASPLPAPPEKLQALVGIDGVALGFPE